LFFFVLSLSLSLSREILVPKDLDTTTTIMELTKWNLMLMVVVVFLGNVAKFGHHPQNSSLPPKQKNTLKISLQKVWTHTHTVIDNFDLRRRLQVLCATIYVCAQEKEFAEKKHS
jgi:hypothetical protein